MLRRELMQAGIRVRVGKVCKDGVPSSLGGGGPGSILPCVRVWPSSRVMSTETSSFTPAYTDEILTVVKRPRRVDGINMARVRFADGREGEVWWCELRASCFHEVP